MALKDLGDQKHQKKNQGIEKSIGCKWGVLKEVMREKRSNDNLVYPYIYLLIHHTSRVWTSSKLLRLNKDMLWDLLKLLIYVKFRLWTLVVCFDVIMVEWCILCVVID